MHNKRALTNSSNVHRNSNQMELEENTVQNTIEQYNNQDQNSQQNQLTKDARKTMFGDYPDF